MNGFQTLGNLFASLKKWLSSLAGSKSASTRAVYIDGSATVSPSVTSAIAAARLPVGAAITSSAGALTTDTSAADFFTITLTESVTMTCTNGVNGKGSTWYITQGPGGNKGVTLDATFVLPDSATPLAWSTTAGKTDVLAAVYSTLLGKWMVVSMIPGY